MLCKWRGKKKFWTVPNVEGNFKGWILGTEITTWTLCSENEFKCKRFSGASDMYRKCTSYLVVPASCVMIQQY
jgi:hypothetical protein